MICRVTTAIGKTWPKAHARKVKGKTVVKVDGVKRKLPHADLARLARTARSAAFTRQRGRDQTSGA